jgi:PAS domain S-box-containing protein
MGVEGRNFFSTKEQLVEQRSLAGVEHAPAGQPSALTGFAASSEHHRILFEQAQDAIFVGRPDGTLTAVNPAACALLGYTEQELLTLNARNLVAPEWLDVVESHASRKLDGLEREAIYELVFLDKQGARIPVEVRSTVLTLDGAVIGLHAVIRDMRPHKRAEAALQESERRFQSAFDAPLVGMALSSVDGRVLKANLALCQLLGRDEHELLERRIWDFVPENDRARVLPLRQAMIDGESATYQADMHALHSNGQVIPIRLSGSIVRDSTGVPAYTVAQITGRTGFDLNPEACPLTSRELEVLTMLAHGATNPTIAQQLGIGTDTVHTYSRRAVQRLRARTRTHAVATAVAAGWIEMDAG